MTAGNVSGKKDGKEFAFPLNLSLTVAKKDGKWLAAMHFSTLNGRHGYRNERHQIAAIDSLAFI